MNNFYIGTAFLSIFVCTMSAQENGKEGEAHYATWLLDLQKKEMPTRNRSKSISNAKFRTQELGDNEDASINVRRNRSASVSQSDKKPDPRIDRILKMTKRMAVDPELNIILRTITVYPKHSKIMRQSKEEEN
jgi:hypothetical protein